LFAIDRHGLAIARLRRHRKIETTIRAAWVYEAAQRKKQPDAQAINVTELR
jgi:hypothetical protein